MQLTHHTPFDSGIAASSLNQLNEVATRAQAIAPREAKRARREDRGAMRCGPLPGEIFAEEAKFGSFT